MPKFLIIALFAGSALATPLAANASLIGQSISGTLATNQGPITTQFVSPAVVGPGAEFVGGFTDVFAQDWVFTVDVGADTITVNITSSSNPDTGNVGSSPLADISLTGFTGLGPMNLQSYSCTSTGFSCTAFGSGPFNTRQSSDSTSFNVGFDTIRSGDSYVFGAGAGGVPEPASWALMLGGFGLAGAALRARRRAMAAA